MSFALRRTIVVASAVTGLLLVPTPVNAQVTLREDVVSVPSYAIGPMAWAADGSLWAAGLGGNAVARGTLNGGRMRKLRAEVSGTDRRVRVR